MAKWIIQDREAGNFIDDFSTLIDAEIAVGNYESADKREGIYKEDFYEIVYDGIKYTDLCTTAKITCMSEFLDKIVPYDWDDINEGDIADLEDNILYTIGSQFWFDEDGFWYDESIGRL